MVEQEFVLRGNVKGMIKILQQDFDVSYEEAKFLVYILMIRGDIEKDNKDDLDLWYLAQDDKYNGQILDTHYAINFTAAKMAIYRSSYSFMVKYLFRKGIDVILMGADLIYVICAAISKIKDEDYCVFARVVELNVGTKGKLFAINDIVTANKDGKCDYQEEDWKCPYLLSDDNCTCNIEKVKIALKNLQDKGIVRAVGDFWMLI